VSYVIVIPARYASTRLPGKLLKDLNGKPVIQHVYERAAESSADSVIIATDDDRIAAAVKKFSGNLCMTASNHQSGTQRIAEVVQLENISPDTVVVNIQGDEPFLPVSCIEQVAQLLMKHDDAEMATLCTPLVEKHELFDSNVVKVVTNKKGEAMYFSRATIPWYRGDYESNVINDEHLRNTYRHIGLYAYRAGFIRQYVDYKPSHIEEIELLEQLRVLWYGHKIAVAEAIEIPGPGIDTADDLEKARTLLLKS
jgi:3-deoxy-manno-octulosonate cytidylyltransferase (CMP-KDO synthetase)